MEFAMNIEKNLSDKEYTYKISCDEMINSYNIIITDATSNVGGNTISFSLLFKNVNSVEINKENYDIL